MIEVECPECSHGYEVVTSQGGRRVNCPKCNAHISVPFRVAALPRRLPPPERGAADAILLLLVGGVTLLAGGAALLLALAWRFG
jgi:DNA-directed RNA polymerase subunit RPC12/RpoP